MTRLEPSDHIESIVGAKRDATLHIGRAVSAEQRVYIMHSKKCSDSGIDLRDCSFSVALDGGIDAQEWDGMEDKAVVLHIAEDTGRLVPLKEADHE